jgi:heme/copper-type cytochrome/quinol oxidase subunit 3
MNPHALDVSALPESALDHRSLIWWGNTLLLMIETTMFALLVASYLYVRMNYAEWPPTLVNGPVAITQPVPPLERPTLTLVILLLSIIPAVISDRAALAMNGRGVRVSFALLVVLGLGAIGLRFYELPALQFSWDDNAYASVIWTIVCLHLLHIIVATAENAAMLIWALTHPIDRKHARDVRVSAAYWYWVVGIWIPLYAMIYFGPRIS